MECKFTEKVSLLIDGEVTGDDARQIQSHLSACSMCQQAKEDFLLLRQEIQNYQRDPDLSAQRQAIYNIVGAERTPFWRRKIALPVPAFALIFLLFVALSLWVAGLRATKSPQPAATIQPPESQEKPPASAKAYDLSRFDKGERAVIYTTKRTRINNEPQRESNP